MDYTKRSPMFLQASQSYVDILNVSPKQIKIEDIILSLSNTCRYNGHINPFYSVLTHSFNVAQLAVFFNSTYESIILSYIHDFAEYLTGDIPRPFKQSMFFKNKDTGEELSFNQLEEKIFNTILDAFNLQFLNTPFNNDAVKYFDDNTLFHELVYLKKLTQDSQGHHITTIWPSHVIFSTDVKPLEFINALKNFIANDIFNNDYPLYEKLEPFLNSLNNFNKSFFEKEQKSSLGESFLREKLKELDFEKINLILTQTPKKKKLSQYKYNTGAFSSTNTQDFNSDDIDFHPDDLAFPVQCQVVDLTNPLNLIQPSELIYATEEA